MKIRIHWGNGYAKVEPEFPTELTDALRYWQRRFEMDPSTYQRVVKGQYRECYQIGADFDAQGNPSRHLLTMPGYIHRIKQVLDKENYEYEIIDERTPFPEPNWRSALAGLRDYQLDCAYTSIASGGGIFACPTGWGKTHIIAAHIRAFAYEELCARNTPITVITCKDQEICRQNAEKLAKILPGREVGLIMSGVRRHSQDIQVITLDSLHHIEAADVGVLIVDEVHEAATEKRSELISTMVNARRWGASATPAGRFDGSDKLTEGLIGPVVYHRTYQQGVDDGALVPIMVLWINVAEPHIGLERYLKYKTRKAKYDHGVEKNNSQIGLITALMQRIPDSMQTLAIMQHTAQMNALVPHLPGVEYVHAKTDQKTLQKARQYDLVAIKAKRRKEIYRDLQAGKIRKIMSTHVYKQGVDFPEMQVMIQAGGGGSAIAGAQIPGRASRPSEGKDVSVVIDFWHPWDTKDKDGKTVPGPVLADDTARDKIYKKLGFERHWVNSLGEIPFLEKSCQ